MAIGSEDTSTSNATRRADGNREKRLKAHRAIDRLLAMAENSDFSGSVTIEVAVDKGLLGRIRLATNAYEH